MFNILRYLLLSLFLLLGGCEQLSFYGKTFIWLSKGYIEYYIIGIKEPVYSESITLPIRTAFDVTQQNYQKTIYFDVKEEHEYTFNINFYNLLYPSYDWKDSPESKLNSELIKATSIMGTIYGLYQEDKSLNNFEVIQNKLAQIRLEPDPCLQCPLGEKAWKRRLTMIQLQKDQFVVADLMLEQFINEQWQTIYQEDNHITYTNAHSGEMNWLTINVLYLKPGRYRTTITNKNAAKFYMPFKQDIEISKQTYRKV